MKNIYITDIKPGEFVHDCFIIAEARQLTAKNGPYWNLILQDKSGKISARIWSPGASQYQNFEPGLVYHVQAQAESYRDITQLNVQSVSAMDQAEIRLSDFVPSSEQDPEDILEEITGLCKTHLTHKPWKKFCLKVLNNPEVKERLLNGYGAKTIHHAYLGGLLEHTLGVCRMCMSMADLYPSLDRQTLLAAAIFHDLGKAWELSTGAVADYTDMGRLLGHIYIGLEVLEPFLRKAKDLDEELKLHFKHIILSHHGEYEFGSPRRPKTQESFALHYADNLDAKLKTVSQATGELDPEASRWTGYQNFLERFLYLPAKTPDPENDSTTKPKADPQCLLPLKE